MNASIFVPRSSFLVLRPCVHLVLLSAACWLLFFHHLDRRDLWNSHEGRAAQDAQTVLSGETSGFPGLFDGQLEMQKPSLYYWCVAGLASLRGGAVDVLDVRLPAALSAWVCVLILYVWGWRNGRPLLGLLAAMILATFVHFTWMARIARIDMPLTLCTCVGLLGLWPRLAGEACSTWRLVAAHMAIAMGVLLKGPIGLVLPSGVLAGWWVCARRQSANRKQGGVGLWWGIPLVVAVALPYFAWAHWRTGGEFTRVFFWYHNVERGFGSDTLAERPWWFYVPRALVDLMPWSLFLPVALWQAFKREAEPLARFGAIWLVTMMAVLSLARFKRSDYLLPAYPGAALLLGSQIERWLRAARRPGLVWGAAATVVLGCLAWWLYYVDIQLPAEEATREYRTFATEIRERVPTPETVWLFRTESHTLAFHLSQRVRTFVEWKDLDRLASGSKPVFVVMRPETAAECRGHLSNGDIEQVSSTDRDGVHHEKPLVLMRTRPKARSSDYVRRE